MPVVPALDAKIAGLIGALLSDVASTGEVGGTIECDLARRWPQFLAPPDPCPVWSTEDPFCDSRPGGAQAELRAAGSHHAQSAPRAPRDPAGKCPRRQKRCRGYN